MEFTFGIITAGDNDHYIQTIIDSIRENHIPIYEIIIVGNTKIQQDGIIRVFEFDETIRAGWITKKKNMIALHAKYENIVLLHDYVKLNSDWYDGFLKFGNDFDWCINRIINTDGIRYRDYTVCFNLITPLMYINYYFVDHCLLPYDFENSVKTNKYMYISGTYYVIKKKIAMQHLLDETLCHNDGEDIELCKRLTENGIIIKCNKYSSVSLIKNKTSLHWEQQIEPNELQQFMDFCDNH